MAFWAVQFLAPAYGIHDILSGTSPQWFGRVMKMEKGNQTPEGGTGERPRLELVDYIEKLAVKRRRIKQKVKRLAQTRRRELGRLLKDIDACRRERGMMEKKRKKSKLYTSSRFIQRRYSNPCLFHRLSAARL